MLFGGLFYLNFGHIAHHGASAIELYDVIPHVIVGFLVAMIGLAIMVTANRRMKALELSTKLHTQKI